MKCILFFGLVLLTSSINGKSSFDGSGEEEMQCAKRQTMEQKNLQLVLDFYQQAFGQQDFTAVDKYISPDYIQHSPHLPNGSQVLKDFLVSLKANKEKGPVDIRRTVVSGDMVWLHLKTEGFNNEPLAVVDIFRIKDGKIVEHWEVIQPIPPMNESKNSNTMF